MIKRKKRKLSTEILGDLVIAFAAALFLCIILVFFSIHIADSFIYSQNIGLTDIEYDYLTSWIFSLGMIVSVIVFVVLFLFLLGQRLSYIPKIMRGIEALRLEKAHEIEIDGNNELSELAESINELSDTQRRVRAEEKALQSEKEELIRSLSHDIRTPLTSIISYSELLAAKDDISDGEARECFDLIRKKGLQIKELTDILLDGGARKLEDFADARLLVAQLADEFETSLEDEFNVVVALALPAFSGKFDVRELQRIFDNLVSNIWKYADRSREVLLKVWLSENCLMISQENAVAERAEKGESYGMGLKSIRRIAGLYGGRAETSEEDGKFKIIISLGVF